MEIGQLAQRPVTLQIAVYFSVGKNAWVAKAVALGKEVPDPFCLRAVWLAKDILLHVELRVQTAVNANAYFKTWTYNEPIAVSSSTNQKFLNIQKLLHKCILYFVQYDDQFRHLMPVSDRVGEIISLCGDKEYQTGTYRANFIIEPDNSIRIIEMNCRFPLNGFFITGFFNLAADAYAKANGLLKIDDHMPFIDYLFSYFGNVDSLCILKKTWKHGMKRETLKKYSPTADFRFPSFLQKNCRKPFAPEKCRRNF